MTATAPLLLTTATDLSNYVAGCRAAGKTVGLVPTMGALHAGHMALVKEARAQTDYVIATIFVNPKQFAPHEDLDRYPRTPERDIALLAAHGAHAVCMPAPGDIYPDGFATSIVPAGVALPLEGEFRPHFFTGVATVVAKLLLMARPDMAFFGEKDYQQLQVITRLAADLNLGVRIAGVGIVREDDGLALSSRNAYLTPEQRTVAVSMNRILFAMAERAATASDMPVLDAWGAAELLKAGFEKIDYCTVRDAQTLLPPTAQTQARRVLAAAWVGQTRLIDNRAVEVEG